MDITDIEVIAFREDRTVGDLIQALQAAGYEVTYDADESRLIVWDGDTGRRIPIIATARADAIKDKRVLGDRYLTLAQANAATGVYVFDGGSVTCYDVREVRGESGIVETQERREASRDSDD